MPDYSSKHWLKVSFIGPTESRNQQYKHTCYHQFVCAKKKGSSLLYLFNVFHAMQELVGN